ncbi:hypothetical protein [Desulfosporosinus youngiae]|uniref:Uncharacterized protein n=1 Tax=Desulfosporosinus youngiae DSM 17734 TaxID=768710 RepID=H5XZS5_9FIRM|nr:hypothetical protein [Desulfosporosinus youngiae]EHQ92121.1 hypothetical protein DesyoDRAFT_5190 [Desulfosporosinus youngiae DSM 17734]
MEFNDLILQVQQLSLELEHLKAALNSRTMWNSPLLSGVVGALTVFLLTVVYNYFRDIGDKRFQHRSFIVAEEIDNLGTRLEGYNYEPTEDIRLVETESLVKLHDRVKTGALCSGTNFLKIENLGPSLVTNVNISIDIEGQISKKRVTLQKRIPIISIKQKVFIFAQDMAFQFEPQLLRKSTITYTTIAGEKMKYTYEVSENEGNTTCKEKYFYKSRFCNFKLIAHADTEPISWIYIKHKRDVKQ